jgi:hypothetical protein
MAWHVWIHACDRRRQALDAEDNPKSLENPVFIFVSLPALEKKLPIKVSRFDVSFSNLTERIALASFPTHSYTNAK